MGGEIRLVPRSTRNWYDIWVGDIQLAETVHMNDCGDLADLVYTELDRQAVHNLLKKEGLI